ncbi:MAG: VOC family protein [Ginsengibacter sp.]|jgi:PhnB protein
MKAVNPYLNFNGNTEEAFNFYKSVFGGEFAMVMRFKEMPESEKMPAGDAEKIMHIALPLKNGSILMATDALECMGQTLTAGNNFYICISTESKEEGNKLFDALSAGGKVGMPYEKQFWGAWHGQFADKFGINWMIDFDENYQ